MLHKLTAENRPITTKWGIDRDAHPALLTLPYRESWLLGNKENIKLFGYCHFNWLMLGFIFDQLGVWNTWVSWRKVPWRIIVLSQSLLGRWIHLDNYHTSLDYHDYHYHKNVNIEITVYNFRKYFQDPLISVTIGRYMDTIHLKKSRPLTFGNYLIFISQ